MCLRQCNLRTDGYLHRCKMPFVLAILTVRACWLLVGLRLVTAQLTKIGGVCSITRMLMFIVSSKGASGLGLLNVNEKGMEFQRPTIPLTSAMRQLLRKVYSEDLASCEWEAVQVFQRKMTELQQRVARLLLAAACQHLHPLTCTYDILRPQLSAEFLSLGLC